MQKHLLGGLLGRARRDEAGQSVLETALVLPVFLLIVLGGLSILFMGFDRLKVQQEVDQVQFLMPADWSSEDMSQEELNSFVKEQLCHSSGLEADKVRVWNAKLTEKQAASSGVALSTGGGIGAKVIKDNDGNPVDSSLYPTFQKVNSYTERATLAYDFSYDMEPLYSGIFPLSSDGSRVQRVYKHVMTDVELAHGTDISASAR